MNNLYGVDVTRLVEMIRKDGQNKEWNATSSVTTSETTSPTTTTTATTPTLQAIRVPPQSSQELTQVNNSSTAAASKFTASLKAFEINKRQKMEKINKSTLARLARVEFENARREENDNDRNL